MIYHKIMAIILMTCLATTCFNVNAQVTECNVATTSDTQAACLLRTPQTSIPPPFLLGELLSKSRIYSTKYFERLGEVFEEYLHDRAIIEYGVGGIGGSLKSETSDMRYFIIHTVTNIKQPYQGQDKAHEVIVSNPYDFNFLRGQVFQIYINFSGKMGTGVDLNSGTPVWGAVTKAKAKGKPEFIYLGKAINVGLFSWHDGNLAKTVEESAWPLALVYLAASIRSRRWLIPAFHGAFEPQFSDEIMQPDFVSKWDRYLRLLVDHLEQLIWVKHQETELGDRLAYFETKFRESINQLVPVKKELPDGRIIEGYDKKQVREAFFRGKTDLVGGLDTEEYAGMRAYVKNYFPLPESIVTAQATRDSESTLVKISIMPNCYSIGTQEGIILSSTLDEAFQHVISFFSKLNRNKKAVDLEVVSVPDGATITLAADGGKGRTVNTNSSITNIFRGLYNYTINKEGFRTIKREVNLVDERGTKLECKLSETEAGSCLLR